MSNNFRIFRTEYKVYLVLSSLKDKSSVRAIVYSNSINLAIKKIHNYMIYYSTIALLLNQ